MHGRAGRGTSFRLAFLALGIAACSSSETVGNAPTDAGTDTPSDSSASDAVSDAKFGTFSDVVDLNVDSGPMPAGHIKCNMGGWYRCDELKMDCCVSKDVCYDPAKEPNFCP